MTYATYSDYTEVWRGRAIRNEEDFERLVIRASAVLDRLTCNRAVKYVDKDGKLSLATCAIAEKIQEEEEREHSIASEKVGDHSVTYREGFACETASEIIALAEMYLSGTGLLYRGIPVVCSA